MSALTSLLVRDQRVSIRQIEEVIQKQVVQGGALEDVLLDLQLVPENVLCAYQAVLAGLSPVAGEEVMTVPASVLARVPKALAVAEQVVPFKEEDGTLWVAIAETPSADAQRALAAKIGMPLSFRFVTAPRLWAALGTHYGAQPPAEMSSLIQELVGREAGDVPYVRPPGGSENAKAPVPGVVFPQQAAENGSGTEVTEVGAVSLEQRSDPEPLRLSKRVRGALTPKRALETLDGCEERDDVVEVLLMFARQYMDFTCLLAVRGERLQGLLAIDAATGARRIRDVEVAGVSVGSTPTVQVPEGLASAVADAIGRVGKLPALVAPVVLRGRAIMLLYGDRAGEPFDVSDLPELVAFLPRVADRLQKIIVAKKQAAVTVPGSESAAPVPAAEVPAQAPDPAVEPTADALPSPEQIPSRQPTKLMPAAKLEAREEVPSRPPAPTPGRYGTRPHSSSGRVPRESLWQLGARRSAPPPPPSEPPEQTQARPEVPLEPRDRSLPQSSEYRLNTAPVDVVAPARQAAPEGTARRRPAEEVVDTATPKVLGNALVRGSEPNVIVEVGASVDVHVDGLVGTPPEHADREIGRLLEVGKAALPALVQRFPGELWIDRRQAGSGRPFAGDVSAVCRALLAFGGVAGPYLVPMLRHPDDDLRYYATLVASDLRCRDVVPELSHRVFDHDRGIAMVALQALPMFVEFKVEMAAAMEFFRLKARATTHAAEHRRAAVRALAACRDVKALDILVPLLDDPSDALARQAHEALVLITCQDFGGSQSRWDQWVSLNRRRHRIEWLVDGLIHPDPDLRAQAGDELKELTQEYFGFVADAPARDREVAQRKYQKWWEREGRARFQA